ncbi:MAG TPA: metallophosphoesterase [Acidobacteriota bacterium]|nr:metallophosphoesterase [Acidobacteriota bacterium]
MAERQEPIEPRYDGRGFFPYLTAFLLIVTVSCSDTPMEPTNAPPHITSGDFVLAVVSERFCFEPAFTDPDGPDAIITYENYPSWLSADSDSLCGTPGETATDTCFVVIVSDGAATDTLVVTLTVIAAGGRPRILSPGAVEAAGGVYFRYQGVAFDSDDSVITISFVDYPTWLAADADSIFGTPLDGSTDTSFVVIASDGSLADSLTVAVKLVRCIIVYGDTRTNDDVHRQIVNLMLPLNPSTVFHVGDLVDDGNSAAEWVTFNSIVSDLVSVAKFYPALGNHEHQAPLYFDNFDLPNNEQWYSVERNNTHFIVLNSCVAIDAASPQYRWLEADLAGVPDSIRFIITVFHYPPYSTGTHVEDELGLRQTLVPLFERYGVDIAFTGHDHDYERSFCGGRYYIVTGGGGAPLRGQARQHPCSQLFVSKYHFCKLSMIGERLIVKVYDVNFELIDQFEPGQSSVDTVGEPTAGIQ